MLIGEYRHTLDPKKRLSLPAKFRKELGKKVIITNGLDRCLYVYTPAEWEKMLGKLKTLSMGQASTRKFNRYLLAGATDVDIDSLGRILIPEFLKEFASLKSVAVLLGVGDRLEIWNERAWDSYKKDTAREADVLAEKLGEIGAI